MPVTGDATVMNRFAEAIARAAAYEDHNIAGGYKYNPSHGSPAVPGVKRRELQAQWNAEEAARKIKFKEDNGIAVGGGKSFLYTPRPQWEYYLWKTIVPMLAYGMFLEFKPKELAAKFSETTPGTVTPKMIGAPIRGNLALNELQRMLKNLGKDIPLRKPVSIRSVQNELIALLDSATGVEKFKLSGEIVGDRAYVDGKPHRIDRDRHGNRRIKLKGRYFYLNPILTE